MLFITPLMTTNSSRVVSQELILQEQSRCLTHVYRLFSVKQDEISSLTVQTVPYAMLQQRFWPTVSPSSQRSEPVAFPFELSATCSVKGSCRVALVVNALRCVGIIVPPRWCTLMVSNGAGTFTHVDLNGTTEPFL